ncbi:hypothetical protein, partial [Thalassospira sp. CH_XMU1420-2]|uniref:hypothetical protein n=1 Tax=Thalassospira sp. CH_XMU1420-2 TaxID=3107769 RepID=UPI00300AD685
MKVKTSLRVAAFCISGLLALPALAGGWNNAKNTADDEVYFDNRVTFYCGCGFAQKVHDIIVIFTGYNQTCLG